MYMLMPSNHFHPLGLRALVLTIRDFIMIVIYTPLDNSGSGLPILGGAPFIWHSRRLELNNHLQSDTPSKPQHMSPGNIYWHYYWHYAICSSQKHFSWPRKTISDVSQQGTLYKGVQIFCILKKCHSLCLCTGMTRLVSTLVVMIQQQVPMPCCEKG